MIRRLAFILIFTFSLFTSKLVAFNAIRDCEIEDVFKEWISDIFKAASLNKDNLKLIFIVNPEINASATIDSTIIVFTGLIMESANVGEILGVLAHETGHIALNHPARQSGAIQQAMKPAFAAIALGAAAAIAGRPDVGAGIAMSAFGFSERAFLHYNRGQEASADQAAARFMEKLNWSPSGMVSFMEKLEKHTLLKNVDPYLLTHPLTHDRIEFFKHATAKSKFSDTPFSFKLNNQYQRIKAKLKAFILPPEKTLLEYQENDQSDIALYARAIAYHRAAKHTLAISEIEKLIARNPKDQYYHELKGQILCENGDLKNGIKSYQDALNINPNNGLLNLITAQVMIEVGQDTQAMTHLNRAKKSEQESPMMWKSLATVHGRLGNQGMASLMLAEFELRFGENHERAKKEASKALKLLHKSESQAIQRAKDLMDELAQKDA